MLQHVPSYYTRHPFSKFVATRTLLPIEEWNHTDRPTRVSKTALNFNLHGSLAWPGRQVRQPSTPSDPRM